MPKRHTPIVSHRPFINWPSGTIVSPPGANVSRLPFGVRGRRSIPDENPHEGWGTGCTPVRVGSIAWPRTHEVSSRLWVDSDVGTIPGGLGTIPRPPGSIAMRETFIPTRETIVPERETIVPEGETIVPEDDTFVDRRHTCVAAGGSSVATRSGSQVCDQTRHAKQQAIEPANRGYEGWAHGIVCHRRGDRSRAPIPRSQGHGDRSRTRGDRRSCPALLRKAPILRTFTPPSPPF
jgi:hypothetical protein